MVRAISTPHNRDLSISRQRSSRIRTIHRNKTISPVTPLPRKENRRNPAGRPAGRPAYIIKAGRPSSVFHILEIYYKEGSIRANAYALETRLIASSTLIQTTLLW